VLGKEWIATPIAVTAFAFSAVNFYNSSVKRQDELKVIVNVGPYVDIDREKKKFTLLMRADLTFINSGNRFVGVSALKVHFEQSNDPAAFSNKCIGSSTTIDFVVEPFVVKPGELVSKKIDTLADGWKTEAENQWISFPFTREGSSYNAGVCFLFSFVTPDVAENDVPIALFVRRFSAQKQEVDDGLSETFVAPNRPVTLVRNRSYGLFD
jgi:hypothetical protein